MALRAQKVSGAFEKRAPGRKKIRRASRSVVTPWAKGMGRGRGSPAHSLLARLLPAFIDQTCSVKQDVWILASFFFFVWVYGPRLRFVHKHAKQELGQYPAISWLHTWSIAHIYSWLLVEFASKQTLGHSVKTWIYVLLVMSDLIAFFIRRR